MTRSQDATPGYWSILQDGSIVSVFYTEIDIGITLDANQTLEEVEDITTLPQRFQNQLTDDAAYQSLKPRRDARDVVFSITLDIMNPIWYNTLTSEQQTALATWRQEWLDYPSSGKLPDNEPISEIFNGLR